MKIYEKNSSVFLEDAENFNIEQIFTCGQCFRFYKTDVNRFEGVAFGKFLSVSQIGDVVTIHNCTFDDFDNLWNVFFDFNTDYGVLSSELMLDDVMKNAVEFGKGIRILKQDLFECVISFIISQNNSIPNIQRVIERISQKYGDFIGIYNNIPRYSFPSPEQLSKSTERELAELKCGYRAGYIYEFVQRIINGELDLNEIASLNSDDGRKILMSYKGIGGKVADCILLFCYHKFDVFPTDVWVKKAMKNLYNIEAKDIDSFSMNYFGKNRGLAQQYLFYYMRSNN